jgi:RNA polymerase sigma-70 factor (ECF subfamily)
MTDWPQIVQQHGPMVWTTLYRLLAHEADAADCFQLTFMSAMEVARTETVRHWPALLQRLATHRALEVLRRRRREEKRFLPLLQDTKAFAKTLEPGQAAEANELAEHVCAVLAELEDGQAQVFCLACLEGWRYEDIAAHLALTVNHVGVLLNRARVTLRERLRSHEPTEARQRREAQP